MSDRVIIGVGGKWAHQTAEAADRMGRRLICVAEDQEVRAALARSDASSAVIVGGASLLAPKQLREVACGSEMPFGYIATDVEQTLQRRLGILMEPTAIAEPDERAGQHITVDAIKGDDVRALLKGRRTPPDSLTIHCHAEGAHADLGSSVLCGVVDDYESKIRDVTVPVEGGCVRGSHCKRMRPRHEEFVYPEQFVTRVLFLLGCNTLVPAGWFYPSTSGLAEAASRTRCEAVLGVSGPLVVRPPLTHALQLAAEAAMPLGELVALLNTCRAFGEDYVFALIGDPETRLADRGPSSDGVADPLPAAIHPWTNQRAAGSVLSLFTPKGEAVEGLLCADKILSARAAGQDIEINDAGERVRRDEKWLATLAARLERAAGLERALVLADRSRLREDELFASGMRLLAQTRAKADAACWSALRENELARRTGVLRPNYLEITASVLDGCDAWSEAAAALHAASVSAEALYHAVHYFDRLVAHRPGGPCQRCGASMRVSLYQRINAPSVGREALDCPVCGSLGERAIDGELPMAEALGDNAPPALPVGPFATFDVEAGQMQVRYPARAVGSGSPVRGYAVLIARNEALGQPVVSSTAYAYSHEPLTLAVDLPDLPPELHTASVCRFAAFDVEIAQRRFLGQAEW